MTVTQSAGLGRMMPRPLLIAIFTFAIAAPPCFGGQGCARGDLSSECPSSEVIQLIASKKRSCVQLQHNGDSGEVVGSSLEDQIDFACGNNNWQEGVMSKYGVCCVLNSVENNGLKMEQANNNTGRAGKSCHETSHFIARAAVQVWSQGDSLKIDDKDATAIFRGFTKARTCLNVLRGVSQPEIKAANRCKHENAGKSVLNLLNLNRITTYLDPYGCGNGVLHGLMEGLVSWLISEIGPQSTLQAMAILSQQQDHQGDVKQEMAMCILEKKKTMNKANDQASIDACIIAEFLTAMCSSPELTKNDPNMLVLACVHGLGHLLSQVAWKCKKSTTMLAFSGWQGSHYECSSVFKAAEGCESLISFPALHDREDQNLKEKTAFWVENCSGGVWHTYRKHLENMVSGEASSTSICGGPYDATSKRKHDVTKKNANAPNKDNVSFRALEDLLHGCTYDKLPLHCFKELFLVLATCIMKTTPSASASASLGEDHDLEVAGRVRSMMPVLFDYCKTTYASIHLRGYCSDGAAQALFTLLMNSHPHFLRNPEYCKLLYSSPPSQQQPAIQFATRAAISSELRLEAARMKRELIDQTTSNMTLSSEDESSDVFVLSFLHGICSSFPDQLSQYFCIHGSFRSLAFLKGVESIGQEDACRLFEDDPSQVKFYNLRRSHPVPYAWIAKLLQTKSTGIKELCDYAWRSELSSERYDFLM